jgi:hypothetical protein
MMVKPWLKTWMCLLLLLLPAAAGRNTEASENNPDWTTPIAPFRIADNLYYVGSKDLASYLVVTPKGDILINSSLESSPPLIRKAWSSLGFTSATSRSC